MRFRTALLCTLVSVVACSPLLASAEAPANCSVFARNLKIGMTGDDVKSLQVFLNGSELTRVSVDGPGSLGNETTYFGQKTMLAVSAFQELYSSEVLTPVGLTKGSGFLGTFSRGKIVTLCASGKVPALTVSAKATTSVATTTKPLIGGKRGYLLGERPVTIVTPAATSSPATQSTSTSPASSTASLQAEIASSSEFSLAVSAYKSDTPVIMYLSSYKGQRGDTITLTGVGFAATGNVVHLDGVAITNATTSSGGAISFIVPQQITTGNHELWVSGNNGESGKTFFVVVEANAIAPTVVSISPEKGPKGTSVIIKGTGFLEKGNTIRTSYGVISDISSSDGTTLQFSVSPSIPSFQKSSDIPVWMTIVNSNGISGSVVFTLSL